jgi:hypothetical protein
MRGLEEAGLVEYNRDEQGEITGIVIKLSGVVGGVGGMSGTLTVGDEDDNDALQGKSGPPPGYRMPTGGHRARIVVA